MRENERDLLSDMEGQKKQQKTLVSLVRFNAVHIGRCHSA